MSEAMAERKRLELEEFEKAQDEGDIPETDMCPSCKTKVKDFKYLNQWAMLRLGWVECTECGTVFAPHSIQTMKLSELMRKKLSPEIK